jgi:outer membrane biosynthesis protein TonB
VIAYYRIYDLPWDLFAEQEQKFRDLLKKVCIAILVAALVLTFLPVPEPDLNEVETIPPRLAQLLLEKQEPPPPPPPVVRNEPEPVKPEPKPVEKTVEPEPVVEKVPEPVIDRTEKARETAAMAGLLPFADELADLRDNQVVASVTNQRNLAGAAGEADRVERSLITSKAGRASGGINTAGMSRNTGGAGLAGRGTTTVSSTVGGLASGPSPQRSGNSDRPARSREEIEMVFDKNKGAIYALYNRALRRDPTLQGKLVLKLTIDPSGAVSMCEVVSSELADDELQRKLVQRVKLFRFLEKDVAPVTTTKPIDFFPA